MHKSFVPNNGVKAWLVLDHLGLHEMGSCGQLETSEFTQCSLWEQRREGAVCRSNKVMHISTCDCANTAIPGTSFSSCWGHRDLKGLMYIFLFKNARISSALINS